MRFVLKTIQVSIGFAVAIWIISNGTSMIHAAWALNTPESQTGVLWAGENLVWNDDRLGTSDIFMRDNQGIISPLLTGVGDQTVLAAGEKSLLIADTATEGQNLYIYGLKDHVLKPLGQHSAVISSSVFADQAAWSDGATVWWWNGQQMSSRPFLTKQLLITSAGLFMLEKDQITLWSDGADQLISCLACVNIAPYLDQIALLDGAGNLKSWPSGQVISKNVSRIWSNRSSLIYEQIDQIYIYRNGESMSSKLVIQSNAQIGPSAIASVDNDDINLDQILPPSVQISACDLTPNVGVCSFLVTGERLMARFTDQSGAEQICIVDVVSSVWSGIIVPYNITDGRYNIAVRAEAALGELSDWVQVGDLFIDHTAPHLIESEIEAQNDAARVHLQTDEKTSATFNLSSPDQSATRTQSRLAFSHTTTFSDLDADQLYNIDAYVADSAHNSIAYHSSFSTPPLTSLSYEILSSLETNLDGVWEGELILPPGVIDDKMAVMRVKSSNGYQLIRLQWTIGRPPPLERHRLVRVKGKVNGAGSAILLHRRKAIAVVNSESEPPTYDAISTSSVLASDQFIEMTGELTSVTKTGWRIKIGDAIWHVHWESNTPDGYAKGDVVYLKGYTFLSNEVVQIAGVAVNLIEKAVPKTNITSSAIDQDTNDQSNDSSTQPTALLAYKLLITTALTPQNIIAERAISIQTANIYDKNQNSWYNLALYGISIVINLTFFFRRRKQTRRA